MSPGRALHAPNAPSGTGGEAPSPTLLIGTDDAATDIALLRLVQALAQRESGIVLQVQPELVRLAKAMDQSIAVLPAGQGLKSQQVRTLSLSSLMCCDGQAAAYPYLNVPLPLLEQCLEAVNRNARGRPSIGVFPAAPGAGKPMLERITQIPGIAWIKGQQIGVPGGIPIPWEDYLDQAALLECLDLVVTSELATALLCGGLGKEVWWLGDPVWAKRELSRVGALSPMLKLAPLNGPADLVVLENALRKWYNCFYDEILDRLPTGGQQAG